MGPNCWMVLREERAEGLGLGAGFSPLELRRLPLSGEVVALRSGEGSGCDAGAGRVALPLRMSMTCRDVGDHHQATPSTISALLWGLSATATSFSVREGGYVACSLCASVSPPCWTPYPRTHPLPSTHWHRRTRTWLLPYTHTHIYGLTIRKSLPPRPPLPPARTLTRRLRATMSGVSL